VHTGAGRISSFAFLIMFRCRNVGSEGGMAGRIRRSTTAGRVAFTIIELMIVITLLGTFAMIAVPKVNTVIMHQRVNEAAVVVSQDLGRALSAAATQRRPVRITVGGDQQSYIVTDAIGGDTLWLRSLGSDDFRVATIEFSASPIDVFPTGFTSEPLVVTLTSSGYSRTITMSTAGWVRNEQ
jgi:type II secretory pathway pseudopilin PulG